LPDSGEDGCGSGETKEETRAPVYSTRWWNFVAHDALEEVSHCMFGVAMIHPIFLLLLHLIGQRGVILVISAFFLSTVIVVFTRRYAKTVAAFIF